MIQTSIESNVASRAPGINTKGYHIRTITYEGPTSIFALLWKEGSTFIYLSPIPLLFPFFQDANHFSPLLSAPPFLSQHWEGMTSQL